MAEKRIKLQSIDYVKDISDCSVECPGEESYLSCKSYASESNSEESLISQYDSESYSSSSESVEVPFVPKRACLADDSIGYTEESTGIFAKMVNNIGYCDKCEEIYEYCIVYEEELVLEKCVYCFNRMSEKVLNLLAGKYKDKLVQRRVEELNKTINKESRMNTSDLCLDESTEGLRIERNNTFADLVDISEKSDSNEEDSISKKYISIKYANQLSDRSEEKSEALGGELSLADAFKARKGYFKSAFENRKMQRTRTVKEPQKVTKLKLEKVVEVKKKKSVKLPSNELLDRLTYGKKVKVKK